MSLISWHGFKVHTDNVPEERPGVYRFTNLIDGKPYIGVSHNVKGRCSGGHGPSEYKFGRAIKKYGKSNFICEPVFYWTAGPHDKIWLCQLEAELIVVHDSIKNGYNIIADHSGIGPFGEEFGNIIKAALANRTPEEVKRWKERLGLAHFGKTHTEEHKKKIGLKLEGIKRSIETKAKLKEIQLRLGKDPKIKAKKRKAALKREAAKTTEDDIRIGKKAWETRRTNFSEQEIKDQHSVITKGRISITNGTLNRKIKPDQPLPEGWHYGFTTDFAKGWETRRRRAALRRIIELLTLRSHQLKD